MVSKESACNLGVPNITLPALGTNHSDLAKFPNRDNGIYQTILRQLIDAKAATVMMSNEQGLPMTAMVVLH